MVLHGEPLALPGHRADVGGGSRNGRSRCHDVAVLPRRWALLVLGVLVVLVGAYSVVHEHLYRVSLFSPAALPEKVQVCGRQFAMSGTTTLTTRRDVDAAAPDREPLRRLGTFAPPLYHRMDILGRPDEPVCGMGVLVGDDDRLTEYVVMGGP